MAHNSALCLRFDIDHRQLPSPAGEATSDGNAYLAMILDHAEQHGATLQFLAQGQKLKERPDELLRAAQAGHAVDSHLYSHHVTLISDPAEVSEELVMTEQLFARQRLTWTGLGVAGTTHGIDKRAPIQKLLVDRGYQWCSTKYDRDRPLAKLQPYWLNDQLLEIPCGGVNDRSYFRDGKAESDGFRQILLELLDEAARDDLICVLDLHPAVLARFDPELTVVDALLDAAAQHTMPTVTYGQICQWKQACQAVETAQISDAHDHHAYWNAQLDLPADQPPTLQEFLQARRRWIDENPLAEGPDPKTFDYIGGWSVQANYQHRDCKINRFALRGRDVFAHKSADTLRVLCVGDSTVFGVLPDEDAATASWPAHLQQHLDEAAPLKFQVLNAGVGGHRSDNLVLRLPNLLNRLQPDVVLMAVLANDAWAAPIADPAAAAAYEPSDYAKNMQNALDLCQNRKIQAILVTQPGLVPADGQLTEAMTGYHQAETLGPEKQPAAMRDLYDKYNATLTALAQNNDVPCLDVAGAFYEELDARKPELFTDTCHMTRLGYGEMGRIVAEKLLALGLIPDDEAESEPEYGEHG